MSTRLVAAVLIGLFAARSLLADPGLLPPAADCHSIPFRSRADWSLARREAALPYPIPTLEGRSIPGEGGTGPPQPVMPEHPNERGQTPPFASAGKLYFQDVTGQDYWCTAQFVGTHRTVLTAAHCVRSWKGEWFKDFFFVRGAGQGKVQHVRLKSVTTWHDYLGMVHANFAYDYAFFFAKTPSNAGWMSLGTVDRSSFLTAIGYPANMGSGRLLLDITGMTGPIGNEEVVPMEPNPMGAGASGGAWLARGPGHDKKHGQIRVVGLNSYRYQSAQDQMVSPRFDAKTKALLDYSAYDCR